jgi:hypothetical protein
MENYRSVFFHGLGQEWADFLYRGPDVPKAINSKNNQIKALNHFFGI